MKRGEPGRYEATVVGGETIRAFVPAPLPPVPALKLDGPLHGALELIVMLFRVINPAVGPALGAIALVAMDLHGWNGSFVVNLPLPAARRR